MSSTEKRKSRRARPTISQADRHKWVWRVFEDPHLSHPAKDVALVLALRFFNDGQNGRCNPGYSGLAKATGWSETAVVDAVEELVQGGWISFTSVGGGTARNTNRYSIDWLRTSTRLPDGSERQPDSADDSVAARVANYDAANPGKTLRQAAKALRVSKSAVHKARQKPVHSDSAAAAKMDKGGQDAKTHKTQQNQEDKCPLKSVHFSKSGQHIVDIYPTENTTEKDFQGTGSRTPEGTGSRTPPPRGNEPLTLPESKCGEALRAPPPAPAAAATARSASQEAFLSEHGDKIQELRNRWPRGFDRWTVADALQAAMESNGVDIDAIIGDKVEAYVAVTEIEKVMPLDKWIRTGEWQKPIDRRPKSKRGGKKPKVDADGDNSTGDTKTRQGQSAAAGGKKTGASALVGLTPEQQQEAIRRRSEGEELMDIANIFGVPGDLIVQREVEYESLKKRYDAEVMAFADLVDKFSLNASGGELRTAWDEITRFRENVINAIAEYEENLPPYEAELDPVFAYRELLGGIADEFEVKVRAAGKKVGIAVGGNKPRHLADRRDLYIDIASTLKAQVLAFERFCILFKFAEAAESDLDDAVAVMETFQEEVVGRAQEFEESLPPFSSAYVANVDPVHQYVLGLDAMATGFGDRLAAARRRIEVEEEFALDDRVFHQKFGCGHVVEIDGNKLTIAFDKGDEKRVVASFVRRATAA